MIKKLKDFLNEQNDVSTFKIGMKIKKVENNSRSGKLSFYCSDGNIIDVAPSGGASIVWDGNIEDISDSTIVEMNISNYQIQLAFDNTDDLYMADDTGGEGLESWLR